MQPSINSPLTAVPELFHSDRKEGEVSAGGLLVSFFEWFGRRVDLPNRPDGKVSVEMDLSSHTRNVIKRDSTASIQSEGLVGDKYVEISFGSKDGSVVRDGNTIGSEPPLEMSALVKRTDDILKQAQEAIRTVNSSSKDLESIGKKINQGTGTVGALINDKTLYQRVDASATAFQEDMEALKHNFLLRGFFRNRGYEDAGELTKNEIRQLPGGSYVKKVAFDARRLFDKPDTAKLKDEKQLKQVGQFLEGNSFGLAVVVARSSMKGDADKERQMTQARAAMVRDYLVQNFRMDDSRVKTMGLGKNGETAGGDAVTILVYPPTAAPKTVAGGH